MTKFRPCIDLHDGRVKQIVGASLEASDDLETNFETDLPPAQFAERYRDDRLTGGHVIMLGPGNREAALEALRAFPGGLQVGGGINSSNAREFLDAGASHVIVTSWIFGEDARLDRGRLNELCEEVGKNRLVIDLSCRKSDDGWVVAMNRWKTPTDVMITGESLDSFVDFCDELLIHAADVEGKCQGMDEDLIRMLGGWGTIPVTYAGGARSLDNLGRVEELSGGKVDLTIGSALDIFGGSLIRYQDCVDWNRRFDL